MSDMNPDSIKIELNGEEFELSFNINVIDTLQDRFDSTFQDLIEQFDNKRKVIKVVKGILTVMINDSIHHSNFVNKSNKPLKTEEEIGYMLTFNNLYNVSNALLDGIINSLPKKSEIDDTPSRK